MTQEELDRQEKLADLYASLEFSQEQIVDITRYTPTSDTVKMVLENELLATNTDSGDWDRIMANMLYSTLDGNIDSLADLLETVYLHAHNEGMIEASADARA
jgi:hypothetical protein